MQTKVSVVVRKEKDKRWSGSVDVVSDVNGTPFYFTKKFNGVRKREDVWKEVRRLIEILSTRTEGGEQ